MTPQRGGTCPPEKANGLRTSVAPEDRKLAPLPRILCKFAGSKSQPLATNPRHECAYRTWGKRSALTVSTFHLHTIAGEPGECYRELLRTILPRLSGIVIQNPSSNHPDVLSCGGGPTFRKEMLTDVKATLVEAAGPLPSMYQSVIPPGM